MINAEFLRGSLQFKRSLWVEQGQFFSFPMFLPSLFILWLEVWFVCPRNVHHLGCIFENRTFCSSKKRYSLFEVLWHVSQMANCFTFVCSFLNATGLIEMAGKEKIQYMCIYIYNMHITFFCNLSAAPTKWGLKGPSPFRIISEGAEPPPEILVIYILDI